MTIGALDAVDEFASNMDIRTSIHRGYRAWATSNQSARQFRNIHLVNAIQQVGLGSFTGAERASSEGLLRIAPIAVAFSDDPGRAFQLGAEAVAMFDADFNTYLSAGVLSLLISRSAQGAAIEEAVEDAMSFIRPVDWCGEVSNMLSGLLDSDQSGRGQGVTCNDLRVGILSVMETKEATEPPDQTRAQAPSRNARLIGINLALARSAGRPV